MVASEQHRRAERRLLPPRRSEIERRLGERRLEVISLDEERRDQGERRRASDRRQPTGRRQPEARGDKLVVLVVSSQEDAARQVRELLEGADPDRFGVVAAEPQASLARLARGGVDVVLLAMSLSARRGFATFTELRALAPAIPFLFLSDSADERHGLEAVRAGAQDFLVQTDLDGEQLARALRHAIERNRLHTALLDLALVDDLTGLYNRRGFLTLATRDLRLAHRGNETMLVAFADLDDLKGVNDAAGHAVGDRALRDTAALLRQTFRDADLVARIGGDEYAVLVRHAGPESAGVLAERLKRQLRDFNRRAGRPISSRSASASRRTKPAPWAPWPACSTGPIARSTGTSGASTTQTDRTPPMAVKRKPRRSDPPPSLRAHLVELLDARPAHVTSDDPT